MHIFKERLKDLRFEHGYKQEEVAKKLNVTPSAYGYYEQGRNEPSLETLLKISNLFQVSIDYLLGKINTTNHITTYHISEKLRMNESELLVIEEMKKRSLLQDMSKQPLENVERMQRYWSFLQKEMHNDDHS